jgi:hypothetical protein
MDLVVYCSDEGAELIPLPETPIDGLDKVKNLTNEIEERINILMNYNYLNIDNKIRMFKECLEARNNMINI